MSYLREKVEEYLKDRVVLISEHDTRYLGCPADHVTAILALFEEEWKALVEQNYRLSVLADSNLKAAEAREEKLREALVKVRRIVETDSQIHSQIKVSNIVSAALGKEEPK